MSNSAPMMAKSELHTAIGRELKSSPWFVIDQPRINQFADVTEDHPMGPFRLNDLTGLDSSHTMGMGAFQQSSDPNGLPPPSLVES
jgi:hypothetical protein